MNYANLGPSSIDDHHASGLAALGVSDNVIDGFVSGLQSKRDLALTLLADIPHLTCPKAQARNNHVDR
jgi:hypothetical protein